MTTAVTDPNYEAGAEVRELSLQEIEAIKNRLRKERIYAGVGIVDVRNFNKFVDFVHELTPEHLVDIGKLVSLCQARKLNVGK